MNNRQYWLKREKAERAYQKAQLKDIDKFNQSIAGLYQQALDDVKKDIAYDIQEINKAGGVEQKRALLNRLNTLQKKVNEWQRLRKIPRKNFSKELKKRIDLLKYTMQLGRDNFIKADIGERLTRLGVDQEGALTDKLLNEYKKEQLRQAGFLKITLKDPTWRDTKTIKRLYTQIGGANYSQRIWANVDVMQANLSKVLASELIRGKNPRDMVNDLTGFLKDDLKSHTYEAERLARTETARIQAQAAMDIFKQDGQKYIKWIAEPVACKVCLDIADYDDGYGRGVYPIEDAPILPAHANCRCSISAYWVNKGR